MNIAITNIFKVFKDENIEYVLFFLNDYLYGFLHMKSISIPQKLQIKLNNEENEALDKLLELIKSKKYNNDILLYINNLLYKRNSLNDKNLKDRVNKKLAEFNKQYNIKNNGDEDLIITTIEISYKTLKGIIENAKSFTTRVRGMGKFNTKNKRKDNSSQLPPMYILRTVKFENGITINITVDENKIEELIDNPFFITQKMLNQKLSGQDFTQGN